jgi:CubicO group peptidase (beta-lactamase class C family)
MSGSHAIKVRPRALGWVLLSLALVAIDTSSAVVAQPRGAPVYPGKAWEQVAPESLGFSSAGLAAAHARLATTASTGLMAVVGGRVVFAYGDVDTVSYVASVRKSLLSMLYGVHVQRGAIDLDATLAQLGIDDRGDLTDVERQARVRDLLTARSGVFHPAANEGDDLAHAPPRGSQPPGTFFLYSNWDFNALGTIFEAATRQSIYDAFQRDLATPIGLQDFRREDHRRTGDATQSIHLAYHFRLSVRDMARLGYLMLRDGRWEDRQIIPAAWVRESTRAIVPVSALNPPEKRNDPWGYGHLWWVWDGANTPSAYRGAYLAAGAAGQFIAVLPALDLVVAHKTVPQGGREVSVGQFLSILDLIVTAKTGATEPVEVRVPESVLREYVGRYELAPGAILTISLEDGGLHAQLTGQRKVAIFAESESTFFFRSTNARISFTRDTTGVVTGLVLHQSGGRQNPARKLLAARPHGSAGSRVRQHGGLHGSSRAGRAARGRAISMDVRYTNLYVWRDGRWQAVASHLSSLR